MSQDQAGCAAGKSIISKLKSKDGNLISNQDTEGRIEDALSIAFNYGVKWQIEQPGSMKYEHAVTMHPGKIYHISYGGSTELVCKFSHDDATQYHFHSMIHFWNGRAQYNKTEYCVKSGITQIREASQQEKLELCRLDIEHNNI